MRIFPRKMLYSDPKFTLGQKKINLKKINYSKPNNTQRLRRKSISLKANITPEEIYYRFIYFLTLLQTSVCLWNTSYQPVFIIIIFYFITLFLRFLTAKSESENFRNTRYITGSILFSVHLPLSFPLSSSYAFRLLY